MAPRWEETKTNFLGLTRFTILQSAKVNDKSAVFLLVALAFAYTEFHHLNSAMQMKRKKGEYAKIEYAQMRKKKEIKNHKAFKNNNKTTDLWFHCVDRIKPLFNEINFKETVWISIPTKYSRCFLLLSKRKLR